MNQITEPGFLGLMDLPGYIVYRRYRFRRKTDIPNSISRSTVFKYPLRSFARSLRLSLNTKNRVLTKKTNLWKILKKGGYRQQLC